MVFYIFKYLQSLFAICLVCSASTLMAAEQSVAEVVNSVETSWAGHVSSAASANVHFLWTTIRIDETKYSADEIEEYFKEFKFSADEACIRRLFQKFNPEVLERFSKHDFSKSPWHLWEEMTLSDDGQNQRSVSQQHEHLIGRGLHLFYMKDLTGFVTAFRNGETRYYFPDLELLMGLPEANFLASVNDIKASPETLTLKTESGSTLLIDRQTHLPVFRNSYNSKAGYGSKTGYGRQKYFRDPTLYPGGVTIPAYQLEVDFEEGTAKDIRFSAVIDAEFNIEIPTSEFVMEVKKGTALVDKRNDHGRARRAEKDIEDVAEFFLASGLSPRAVASPASAEFNWKSFFLIANGVFLILAGILLWRRSRT